VLAALLVAALIPGCDWDIGQFLFHPSVEQRVVESLSMTAPAPAVVDPDSFSFAVFGDVHYTLGAHPALARFRREVEERGIDFFLVLGDLAHDGTEAQMRRARAGLDSVGIPYYVTNGNHDLFQAEAWPSFKAEFGPSCYSVVIADKLKVIFLDTAEGRLGERQFAWLEQELATAGDRIKFVGTHFPLYDGRVPGVYRMASGRERARLQSLLQEHAVFAIASGHIHGWRDTEVEGVHHFITGTMQATADGLDFGRLGYLLVTFRHDSLSWQRIDF
jgi:3',5'-cyclic AMP phosphodiesterase CpdA